ncbi:hypothetical protein [Rhodoferax sp. GW822-FHT02A01]|uniref:hypothetical protein n=1 Tax=Rhodoferax sp. GW822-FHT02A01 TaxID=3141537 RepID=UPI00315CD42B
MLIQSVRALRFMCLAAAAALLAACGGGSSSPTLSGVAAVGVPIVSGSVKVSCAGGSALNTTTSSSGSWSVTTSGQTLPCAVQVSGGTAGGAANTTPYHSIALSFGTVNITPLTDLVVAQMLGAAPQTWFASPAFSSVNATSLNAALTTVSSSLGMTSTLGTVNPFTTAFVPQNGVLLDDVLEAIKTALTNQSQTYAALLAAAQAGNYATFTGFGTAFTVAYGSVSGPGSSGVTSCANGETKMTYFGTSGKYADGQSVCFTGSATALSFSGKTLTSPTLNGAVTSPFSAYVFTDASDNYKYEMILDSGALYEINVSNGPTYVGQFVTGSLTVETTVMGVTTSISIGGIHAPADQSTFCSGILTDNSITSLTSAGGSLTIDSCSFSGNVGNIAATLHVTTPVTLNTSYTIKYTYN